MLIEWVKEEIRLLELIEMRTWENLMGVRLRGFVSLFYLKLDIT
ncbi:hypothetical protein C5S29_15715 [ANME-1 cluster archaeon GoMg3.2]|jgi:hypothetical protein|nr:hypothetical protein [ANME-1 cluster archaeon GoMg3.2]